MHRDLDDAFAAALARFGPFEPEPRLAVACSGGPDSVALLRLAADWARARGADALALIVDHGLRAESADEATQAAALATRCGCRSDVLRWSPPVAAGQ
ncbi:MAG: ATP-binding protein, partial [Pseudomonadota bacterium]